jgi:hypothetical protein
MKKYAAISGSAVIAVTIMSTMITIFPTPTAYPQAQSTPQGGALSLVFPANSMPYGMTYEQWTTKWWQWFLSIPQDQSPANDPSGAQCAVNQNDPHVWLLAGNFGGQTERTCTIPAGKGLVIEPVGWTCNDKQDLRPSTPRDNSSIQAELTKCTQDPINQLRLAVVEINGERIPNIEDYIVTTPLSSVTFPTNALFNAPEGPALFVSTGPTIITNPLPPGNYTIHTAAQIIDPINPAYNFANDITIHINAK